MHTHTQYTHTTRTHEHTHTNTQTHIRARTHTHTHTHMRAQDCVFAVFAQFLRDVGARPHATLELTLPLKAASMPLAACLPNALSTPEKKRLFSRARRAAARACARIIRALCQRSHPRCRMTQAHGTWGTQHAGCMSGGSAHTRDPVHAGRQGTSIFWRFFSQLGCEADEDEESDQCPYQPVLPWPLPLDSMLVSSSLLSSLLSWSLENCDMSESESRSCTSSLLPALPLLTAMTSSAIATAATATIDTVRKRIGLPAAAGAGSGAGTAAP